MAFRNETGGSFLRSYNPWGQSLAQGLTTCLKPNSTAFENNQFIGKVGKFD